MSDLTCVSTTAAFRQAPRTKWKAGVIDVVPGVTSQVFIRPNQCMFWRHATYATMPPGKPKEFSVSRFTHNPQRSNCRQGCPQEPEWGDEPSVILFRAGDRQCASASSAGVYEVLSNGGFGNPGLGGFWSSGRGPRQVLKCLLNCFALAF